MKEVCENCGLTFGAHLANSYDSDFYKRYFSRGTCPGHEGRMDWDMGPGTTFKASGMIGEIPYNHEAKGVKNDRPQG